MIHSSSIIFICNKICENVKLSKLCSVLCFISQGSMNTQRFSTPVSNTQPYQDVSRAGGWNDPPVIRPRPVVSFSIQLASFTVCTKVSVSSLYCT